jgi:hypothetical protein
VRARCAPTRSDARERLDLLTVGIEGAAAIELLGHVGVDLGERHALGRAEGRGRLRPRPFRLDAAVLLAFVVGARFEMAPHDPSRHQLLAARVDDLVPAVVGGDLPHHRARWQARLDVVAPV